MHFAPQGKAPEAANWLMRQGADIDAKAENGEIPFDEAKKEGNEDMVRLLRGLGGRCAKDW